jgi:hypothetical protein
VAQRHRPSLASSYDYRRSWSQYAAVLRRRSL